MAEIMKMGKKSPAFDPVHEKLIFEARSSDPHAYLGMHTLNNGTVIRVFDPEAEEVYVIFPDGVKTLMERGNSDGMFYCLLENKKEHCDYTLEKHYADNKIFVSADAYHFLPGIGETDIYLFNAGDHRKIYDVMGAHIRTYGDVSGVEFTVWAPNAERVSVVGNFNCWDGRRNQMRRMGASGIWELFIPSLGDGEVYKFEIRSAGGDVFTKLDPYARRTEMRPSNAAIVCGNENFKWNDAKWMKKRASSQVLSKPLNIYEVHLGSWGGPGLQTPQDGKEFNNYRELAHALGDYVIRMGYTHIELLPVCEHPLDQSWGYQVTGFFAPTARYGTPEDFAYFVDYMHDHGIGVILDWVPAHFPKDAFSLGRFDGTALYEHADPRQGEQKDWGTYIFNFGRNEVANFLLGSALYWLERFHIDGLRVDAVASMLYLDYSRENGEWIPNKYGGNENLEAIAFLKRLNELAHSLNPGIMMIAEESTAWPGVSKPVYLGGLGFTFKWNMGWMHDTLDYFSLDPIYRSYNHGRLTFSLIYAFSENFVLPLSHDEVVHGKKSLLGRMPGDYQQKFANLRALYAYMMTHPGKKLLFMGGEFAQMIEWNSNQALDWMLLDYPMHRAMRDLCSSLNKFYSAHKALYECDFESAGFEWLDGGDYRQSIISYIRWDKARKEPLVVIVNLTPVVRDYFRLGVPFAGEWREVFNTDAHEFGGTGLLNTETMETSSGLCHGQKQSVVLRLPWLGAVILQRVSKK